MNVIDKLTEYFTKFPGIGSRQARRLVYFLLTRDSYFLEQLSDLILRLRTEISECPSCHHLFSSDKNKAGLCDVCQSPNTEKGVLMVVEKDVDLENIKKSGVYHGRYFILGGSLPILEDNPASKIRVKELLSEVEKQIKENDLKEVVLAMSVNPEGENTKDYINKILEPFSKESGLKVSSLGRGLSTGTELEYSDSDTLQSALDSRR